MAAIAQDATRAKLGARDTLDAKLAILADVDQHALSALVPLARRYRIDFLDGRPITGTPSTEQVAEQTHETPPKISSNWRIGTAVLLFCIQIYEYIQWRGSPLCVRNAALVMPNDRA